MSLSSLAIHSTRNGAFPTVGLFLLFSDLFSASKYSILESSTLLTSTLVSELLLPFKTDEKGLTVEADALDTEMLSSVGSS